MSGPIGEGNGEYRGLPLEETGRDEFRYGYCGVCGGAWVLVKREESGLWHYVRLGYVSESRRFHTLEQCLDEACEDILRSKY
ncbi:hypothetical protein [Pseudoflavonifractor sp. 60]|uniref:hypothetical protein n=1 Tax=Pseudoflavonifractor sp. 60 TaxID=2304576 RepID=UPI00136A1326|nr:hypothetical protein [Pseudoflavonifractor sp. 60]